MASTIASRDLRNHTREVLDRVLNGDVVTITVNGKPVADLRPHAGHRRSSLTKAEFLDVVSRQPPDPALAADLMWISEGDTDELGPIQ